MGLPFEECLETAQNTVVRFNWCQLIDPEGQ